MDEDIRREALLEIAAKTRDMSSLVSRLLELSRAEHGAGMIHLEPVDISELVDLVSEELFDSAQKNIFL